MFKKGDWQKPLQERLSQRLERTNSELPRAMTARMVEVEYGLSLLKEIGLLDELIICLPDLLTLHPLPALKHLDERQWQLIKYARYRLPSYVSRQRWHDDLREYAKLPSVVQLYSLVADGLETTTLKAALKPADNPHDIDVYEKIIKKRPPYERYDYVAPKSGQTYHFYAEPTNKRYRHHVAVELPELDKIIAPQWATHLRGKMSDDDFALFIDKKQKPERLPYNFGWDEHIKAESQLMQQKSPDSDWESRFSNMSIRSIGEASAADNFAINGTVHLVGMVGSGKSSLVKTIAHLLARSQGSDRMAVIVPSTMEAFNFANELNQLLGYTVDDMPAAVVYYGWSNREKHINAFLNEYGDDPNHIGHRWVSSSCALMSLIHPSDIVAMGSPPRLGSEPCERLSDGPLEPDKNNEGPFKAANNQNVSCPFFAQCPSHQKLRDLAQARIVVTTAGALQSRLPVNFDPRRPLLSDYLYEQMDIIFVDEADEVQAFEDDQFVNSVPLWNLPGALFSSADAFVSEALRREKLNELQENWAFSVRDGVKYITPMLRMLNQTGNRSLRRWLGRSYFSAYRLFQTIARRMIGLPDFIPLGEMNDEETKRYNFFRDIFSLITAQDFTKLPDPDYVPKKQLQHYGDLLALRYAGKLRDILFKATTNIPRDFESDLQLLIAKMLEDKGLSIETSLRELDQALQALNEEEKIIYYPDQDCETPETLARKLMFALLAAGLDREMRLLVYNADTRPSNISSIDVGSFNPNFRSEHHALPIAYTGSIFGTYYTPEERGPEHQGGERGEHENLSRLEYINPGRELLLGFHDLYKAFGVYGPHVVFLSGTSYLPDSSRWHIRIPVSLVLEANPEWSKTIEVDSEYTFEPAFYFDEKKTKTPIYVSGAAGIAGDNDRAKEEALKHIAQYWAKEKTLENQLEDIRKRGGKWQGRERILLFVNSYTQAKFLGERIRQYTSLTDDDVQWLKPSDDESESDGIARAAIERIADTSLKILVAPLLAIGRGHNILTSDRKAAFGAVYFVVRPLTPPGDVNGIAAEINHLAPLWLNEPHPDIESKQTIHEQETELRSLALSHWHKAEKRSFYASLDASERRDLAATTFGRFVQASGRLVRGGVPMVVKFVDAAWAPESAKRHAGGARKTDTSKTSLLVEMICRLKAYTSPKGSIGHILYQPFSGLKDIKGLFFNKDKCDE